MKNLFKTAATPFIKTADAVNGFFTSIYEKNVQSLYDYARQNPSDPLYHAIESDLLKEVQKINREEFAHKKAATPSTGVLAA